jgi:uncharacterized Zn finger protein (UPF0148 family)
VTLVNCPTMFLKGKQPLRRFGADNMTATKLVMELSARTPLRKTSDCLTLFCPICEIAFTRKASEAKRHSVSYCGRACAGIGCRRQVKVSCRACGAPFTVKKSHVGHITCCSEKCSRTVKSKTTSKADIERWKNGMFSGGSRASGAKLTEEQALMILRDSRRHAAIALDYGITRAAISHLKRGDTWMHLKDFLVTP